jgi:hypothetical protein
MLLPNEAVDIIPMINRENFNEYLKLKDYTLIEVYASKCLGCSKLEKLIPNITD